jgi:dihydroneopterin aldolase
MDVNEQYFNNISERERAIFEGAITMGALFHQFVGTPVNTENAATLERSIKDAMELQPCIKKVEVVINKEILEKVKNEYSYMSLTGDMLDVKVVAEYGDRKAFIRLRYIEDLNYPLMYVEKIE